MFRRSCSISDNVTDPIFSNFLILLNFCSAQPEVPLSKLHHPYRRNWHRSDPDSVT